MIIQNWYGEVLKVTVKQIKNCKPKVAEAETIRWATQLTKQENLNKVIIESEAKLCIDPTKKFKA